MYSAGSSENGDESLGVPPVLESSEPESPVLELADSEAPDSAESEARKDTRSESDSAGAQPQASNAAKKEMEETERFEYGMS